MKQTPLYPLHRELGAKFGPFAGFEMPLFYPAGILAEHRHTRSRCGLFDISHMVQVEIEGPHAAALVSRLCPYPADEQKAGRARYSFFLNNSAGIIDDLIVTRLGETRFMIVCNAGCAEKDLAHIRDHAGKFDVAVRVRDRAFLAVQGPQAEQVLSDAGIGELPATFLDAGELPGDRFISRTGYTGEDGFEILVPIRAATSLWRTVLEPQNNCHPIGLGARDTLRMEMGYLLSGQDFHDNRTTLETGYDWVVKWNHDFIGKGALEAQKGAGNYSRFGAVVLEEHGVPRGGHNVLSLDGAPIGKLTSGTMSPTLGVGIGLGYFEHMATVPGTKVYIEIREKRVGARIEKAPLVKKAQP